MFPWHVFSPGEILVWPPGGLFEQKGSWLSEILWSKLTVKYDS